MQEMKDVNVNVGEIDLRPWQKDLMKLINKPTKSQVIWIKGRSGDEGKRVLRHNPDCHYPGFH